MNEINVAVLGNPNAGKTSLFNLLAGLNQKVGNWPGVTVEKKEGQWKYEDKAYKLIDLPGIYDFSSLSLDEKVSRDFLLDSRPDMVLFVADATKLSRSLFLALQVLEMKIPIVFALNMKDMAEKKGLKINSSKLSQILGSPVCSISARKNQGIDELKEELNNFDYEKSRAHPVLYYDEYENLLLEEELKAVEKLLPESHPSSRYLAMQLLEGEEDMEKRFFTDGCPEALKNIRKMVKEKFHQDTDLLIAEKRYAFAQGIALEVSSRTVSVEDKINFSDKLDRIFTNRYLGIPIFLTIMWLMFEAVFSVGNPLADFLDGGVSTLGEYIQTSMGKGFWTLLIVDGVLGGVGSLVVLLPNILIMFLFMAVLEDSGYMARAAFVMDSLMHRLGLHGKSFIPMLMGFGCNVPGIMATRTIETNKDRLLTILVLPFISCAARLPVYILFTGIFFKNHQGTVVFSLYFLGIIVAVLSAKLLKKLFFKEESMPLIMELPFYQRPSIKKLSYHMWERAGVYLKKAATIILAGSILVWLLSSLPFGTQYAGADSWIAFIGKTIAPVLKPAGFGYWQVAVALLFGIVAKETVVSTFGTLLAAQGALSVALPKIFTPVSAYAFLVMTLLYIPCLATVAVMKREAGTKWTFVGVTYSFFIGWLGAVLVNQLGNLIF